MTDSLAMSVIKEKKEYIQKQYHFVAKEFRIPVEELDEKSTMAIIANARYGVNFKGKVGLRLEIMKNENTGVINYLFDAIADEFINDYYVTDVSKLIGKPIKVVTVTNRTLWIEPMKIELGEKEG